MGILKIDELSGFKFNDNIKTNTSLANFLDVYLTGYRTLDVMRERKLRFTLLCGRTDH